MSGGVIGPPQLPPRLSPRDTFCQGCSMTVHFRLRRNFPVGRTLVESGPQVIERRTGSMGRLDGRVLLITGAARGLGEVEARLAVEQGGKVLICDVRDELGLAVADDLGDAADYAPC